MLLLIQMMDRCIPNIYVMEQRLVEIYTFNDLKPTKNILWRTSSSAFLETEHDATPDLTRHGRPSKLIDE